MEQVSSPIAHALSEVDAVIEEEVLIEAFGSKSNGNRRDIVPTNIEYAIREKVINARILKALNLQSQRIVKIPNNKLNFVTRGYDRAVVKVSKKALNGCSIITPLSVVYSDDYDTFGTESFDADYAQSITEGRFQRMLRGHENIPNVQTSDLRLIGPNTILIENFAFAERIAILATISHDPEMMTLPRGYWNEFAQLVLLATEAFIYKKLRIKVDRAKLSGGMELGVFKEIIDEFKDSEKMYQELLAKFRKYDNLGNAKARMRAAKGQTAAYAM